MIARLLREPLLHFVVGGGLLFVLLSRLGAGPVRDAAAVGRDAAAVARAGTGVGNDASADPDRRSRAAVAERSPIHVDREALLAFVARSTREARLDEVARSFDALPLAARRDWVERFVREEALVREARALGLDRDDELIRRHLVQKMEFLAIGAVDANAAADPAALEAWYALHADDYRVPGTVRFSHVFARDRAQAASLLGRLVSEGRSGAEAIAWGERFLYDRHYVDRTLDEIRSHFGPDFAADLARLEPDPRRWQGPLASDHGWHLVLLDHREPDRLPPLAEVLDRVRRDLRRAEEERALEVAIAEIVSQHRVELAPGLLPAPAGQP